LQIAWRIWVHYWLTPVDVFDESSNGDDDGISNTHDDDTNKHKQLLERILKVTSTFQAKPTNQFGLISHGYIII
jgi:hypothetical protein